jgi:hypothetical protein
MEVVMAGKARLMDSHAQSANPVAKAPL